MTTRSHKSRRRTALILAGGEGTRLRSYTRRHFGHEIPKQFCRLVSEKTLLEETIERAQAVVDEEINVILTASHRPFYSSLLTVDERLHAVVQPGDRGTGIALLYGLMRLAKESSASSVIILPSDHYLSDTERFAEQIDAIFRFVESNPEMTVLVGARPESADTSYGWIEPGEQLVGGAVPIREVRRFWEKPSSAAVVELLQRGCLWNTFIMVGSVTNLIERIRAVTPQAYEVFRTVWDKLQKEELSAVEWAYSLVKPVNFSSEVLAGDPANLAVAALRDIDWNDLGEPQRLEELLGRLSSGQKKQVA